MNRNRSEHQTVVSPHERVRGCGGKRCYTDHAVAERMAKNTRRHRNAKVEAYKCRHCHSWHIGELD